MARSSPTSYIPTVGSIVTRNTENSWVDLSNNNVLNKTNFTLYWEGYLFSGSGTGMSFCLSDTNTASSNTNQLGWFDSIQPFYNIGAVRTNSGATVSGNTFVKLAIQYDNGNARFFRNGVEIWSTQAMPVFDYRYLVINSGDSTYATDKIALFNRSFTPAECLNLTSL